MNEYIASPTKIGDYVLNSVYNGKYISTDVESNLFLLNKPLRGDYVPQKLYPLKNEKNERNRKFTNTIEEPVGTRVKQRESTITRYQYLPENPQNTSHIIINELHRGGEQSRIVYKDSN
jgi:hypothetical protein